MPSPRYPAGRCEIHIPLEKVDDFMIYGCRRYTAVSIHLCGHALKDLRFSPGLEKDGKVGMTADIYKSGRNYKPFCVSDILPFTINNLSDPRHLSIP